MQERRRGRGENNIERVIRRNDIDAISSREQRGVGLAWKKTGVKLESRRGCIKAIGERALLEETFRPIARRQENL